MPTRKLAAVLVATLFALGLALATGLSANQADRSSDKVTELKQQRIEVLKQLVENAKINYQNGRQPFGQLLAARESLFSAQLALETDHQKRIELYEKRLEIFKFDEELAKSRVSVGDATADDQLRATAQRLLAEIDLAEEATT